MTLGGWANTVVGYDLKNQLYQTSAGNSFIPADIPLTTSKGEKSDFYINPLGGVVFFQIVGLAGTKNEISAFIKLGTGGMTPWLGYNDTYAIKIQYWSKIKNFIHLISSQNGR